MTTKTTVDTFVYTGASRPTPHFGLMIFSPSSCNNEKNNSKDNDNKENDNKDKDYKDKDIDNNDNKDSSVTALQANKHHPLFFSPSLTFYSLSLPFLSFFTPSILVISLSTTSILSQLMFCESIHPL